MAKHAIIYGFLLIVVGVVGYFATDRVSLTALIPAAFGLVILLLGALGQAKEDLNKHAMHAALVVALLGFLGTVTALPDLIAVFQGNEEAIANRAATMSRSVTAVISLAFIIQGIRSFIAARKARGA